MSQETLLLWRGAQVMAPDVWRAARRALCPRGPRLFPPPLPWAGLPAPGTGARAAAGKLSAAPNLERWWGVVSYLEPGAPSPT